jgi:hypothetical protein
MVRAAGITAGTLFIAIGLAAQLGSADIFGARGSVRPVSQAPAARPSAPASPNPSPNPSPSAQPSPQQLDLAVTAEGTIFNFSGNGGGGPHKKRKG